MNRTIATVSRRLYSSSRRLAAADSGAGSGFLNLNFNLPHQSIYNQKEVDKVILPGEDGEFGVTAGHSPMINQLQPGMVTVVHTSGESEKFFVSGGFAVTGAEGTNVSCPEAYPLSEFDPAVVKSELSAAMADTTPEGAIKVSVFSSLARALGV